MDARGLAGSIRARLGRPGLALRGASMSVLRTPSAFYDALLAGVERAQRRVCLAALYLGTGRLETDLVHVLTERLSNSRGEHRPQVSVLLDYMRATRLDAKDRSSLTCLRPALDAGAAVHLFRPPAQSGAALLLPPRVNEAVAVQHVKALVFDDDVIITGANLSHDYFTSRQDRYLLVRGEAALASELASLAASVADCSWQVAPADADTDTGADVDADAEAARGVRQPLRGEAHKGMAALPPKALRAAGARHGSVDLRAALRERLGAFDGRGTVALGRCQEVGQGEDTCGKARAEDAGADTWAFLTVQLGSVGVRVDQRACEHIMAFPGGLGGRVTLSSAYLNLGHATLRALASPAAPGVSVPPAHSVGADTAAVASANRRSVELVTAAEDANGFFQSAGLSQHIPLAYAILEYRAVAWLSRRLLSMGTVLAFRLWRRPGWTFHAKGLWYEAPVEAGTDVALFQAPSVTVIGSSNYGARSTERDLEAQLVIVTSNSELRKALAEELAGLRADALECSLERARERAFASSSMSFRALVATVLGHFL